MAANSVNILRTLQGVNCTAYELYLSEALKMYTYKKNKTKLEAP